MLIEPRLYVTKYLKDLINQLDVQTTKFIIKVVAGNSKINSLKTGDR